MTDNEQNEGTWEGDDAELGAELAAAARRRLSRALLTRAGWR